MRVIEVFDPPMCCSSGVCGEEVEEELIIFSADVNWLIEQGATIRRYNLAQEPRAFIENKQVQSMLNSEGEGCLPIILADGALVSTGSYPSRQQLAQAVGISMPKTAAESVFNEQVAELVALGAAIASNCETCFEYHYKAALRLGVSEDDMINATNVALTVKEQPATLVRNRAQALLTPQPAKGGGGCCGGNSGSSCC